ncbi:MAG: hypothetical protein KIT69_02035 [Propionibacteriaceae bacterium]|nr:hypothetical protein [Propionibacteriaceae bacterium]
MGHRRRRRDPRRGHLPPPSGGPGDRRSSAVVLVVLLNISYIIAHGLGYDLTFSGGLPAFRATAAPV